MDGVYRRTLMYTPAVHRTQIHLDERHLAALDRISRETGASRSELIRRAIDVVYDGGAPRELPRSIGVATNPHVRASEAKESLRRRWVDTRRAGR